MTDKKTKRKQTIKVLIFLAIIFFVTGILSVKVFYKPNNIALATNVAETIDIMGEKNPVLSFFEEKVKEMEEQIRIEQERIAEEKRIEEEKIAAEKAKLEAEKRKNMKKAYLTFDDGPSKTVTPQILDILDEYDIKATFFVVGKMVNTNSDILKRIYEEGHSIGNHSYSHNYSYIYKNYNNFMEEINLTNNAMKNVLGEDFRTDLLRFPGGSFDKYKKKFVDYAKEKGYEIYDWNALNGDAEGVGLSKSRLVNRFKESSKGRKDLIILMHDTDAKQTTVDALPEIIEYLINEGYIFEPLAQVKEELVTNE